MSKVEPEGKCPCSFGGCCATSGNSERCCACHPDGAYIGNGGPLPCTNAWHARQVKVCKCAQVACCRAVEANFADGHPCCVCELPHANISGVRLSCLSCGKQPDPPPAPQRKVARVVEGFVNEDTASRIGEKLSQHNFFGSPLAGRIPATLTIYEPEPVKVPTLVEAVEEVLEHYRNSELIPFENLRAALAREKGKR